MIFGLRRTVLSGTMALGSLPPNTLGTDSLVHNLSDACLVEKSILAASPAPQDFKERYDSLFFKTQMLTFARTWRAVHSSWQ